MKTMKNDTRYIIKRILIGVGIALILGLLGKKGVLAETTTNLYLNTTSSYNSGDTIDIITTIKPQHYENVSSLPFPYEENVNLTFITDIDKNYFYIDMFYKDNIFYYVYSDDISYSGINISYAGSQLRNFTANSSSITSSYYVFALTSETSNSSIINTSLNPDNSATLNQVNISLNNNTYYLYYLSYSDDDFINIFQNSISYGNNDFFKSQNYYRYYTGPNIVSTTSFYYDISTNNNVPFISTEPDYSQISIPSYFHEIDLTNYQAVYFVPIDYVLVPSFIKDSKEYLHFNYYLNGSVNSGYFNIENSNDDFNFNSDENLVSFSDFTYIESSFPLYFKDDDLSAFMLFNTGNTTKIKYDSRYYNYYLVSDLSDYSNEVQFIDENGQQVSRYISFTALLEDYWLKGFTSGGDSFINDSCSDGGICADHIKSYIDFLKMPFSFLRNLSKDKCAPINIPIPFVNGNIPINCLSLLFQNILGNFYNILLYIITGLYAYRITLLNIDTITDVLNPSDDKLEVVDL